MYIPCQLELLGAHTPCSIVLMPFLTNQYYANASFTSLHTSVLYNCNPCFHSLEVRCREKREEIGILNEKMEEQKIKEEAALYVNVSWCT